MNEILEILITYWKPIVGLLFTIAGFIIAIIKKKPVNDILTDIYNYAVIAVKVTEADSYCNDNLKGDAKLNAAVAHVNHLLKLKYPTLDVGKYLKMIETVIEDLLSTPHKKG